VQYVLEHQLILVHAMLVASVISGIIMKQDALLLTLIMEIACGHMVD